MRRPAVLLILVCGFALDAIGCAATDADGGAAQSAETSGLPDAYNAQIPHTGLSYSAADKTVSIPFGIHRVTLQSGGGAQAYVGTWWPAGGEDGIPAKIAFAGGRFQVFDLTTSVKRIDLGYFFDADGSLVIDNGTIKTRLVRGDLGAWSPLVLVQRAVAHNGVPHYLDFEPPFGLQIVNTEAQPITPGDIGTITAKGDVTVEEPFYDDQNHLHIIGDLGCSARLSGSTEVMSDCQIEVTASATAQTAVFRVTGPTSGEVELALEHPWMALLQDDRKYSYDLLVRMGMTAGSSIMLSQGYNSAYHHSLN
jgi:hypothetical protein